MIMLILIIKTFIFYEQRNNKIKEVNKTEPREIIQVWNKKKLAGFYNEVNPVLAALDSFQFYFFFPLIKRYFEESLQPSNGSVTKYSLTSPYAHLYNTDTSLLRTVRLVPEMPKIIFSLPL